MKLDFNEFKKMLKYFFVWNLIIIELKWFGMQFKVKYFIFEMSE